MPRATKANQLVLGLKKVLEDFKIAQGSRSLAIAAKKEKFLTRGPTLEDLNSVDQSEKRRLTKDMIAGINVNGGNVKILEKWEGEKKVAFMKKEEDGIGAIFGNMLYRVLSAKTYAGKRVSSYENSNSAVIKWDENLSTFHSSRPGRIFKSSIDPTGNQKDFEFVKSYARAVAVEGVLGETDYNPRNILRSAKTNRVVFIDRTALGNHNRGYYEHHGYGSAASNDFLRIFLGQKNENLAYVDTHAAYDKVALKYDSLFRTSNIHLTIAYNRLTALEYSGEQNSENYRKALRTYKELYQQRKGLEAERTEALHQAFVNSYRKGIDENLFQDIIKNIETPGNEHLKAFFIEFMSGIEDSINLADDKEFLESYINKVIKEAGGESKVKLEILEGKFLANAEFAKNQYKTLLDHYHKIKAQIKPKQTPEELKSEEPAVANLGQEAKSEIKNQPLADGQEKKNTIVKSEIEVKLDSYEEAYKELLAQYNEFNALIKEFKEELTKPENQTSEFKEQSELEITKFFKVKSIIVEELEDLISKYDGISVVDIFRKATSEKFPKLLTKKAKIKVSIEGLIKNISRNTENLAETTASPRKKRTEAVVAVKNMDFNAEALSGADEKLKSEAKKEASVLKRKTATSQKPKEPALNKGVEKKPHVLKQRTATNQKPTKPALDKGTVVGEALAAKVRRRPAILKQKTSGKKTEEADTAKRRMKGVRTEAPKTEVKAKKSTNPAKRHPQPKQATIERAFEAASKSIGTKTSVELNRETLFNALKRTIKKINEKGQNISKPNLKEIWQSNKPKERKLLSHFFNNIHRTKIKISPNLNTDLGPSDVLKVMNFLVTTKDSVSTYLENRLTQDSGINDSGIVSDADSSSGLNSSSEEPKTSPLNAEAKILRDPVFTEIEV